MNTDDEEEDEEAEPCEISPLAASQTRELASQRIVVAPSVGALPCVYVYVCGGTLSLRGRVIKIAPLV